MALTLHLVGTASQSGSGNFMFTGTSTSMGNLTGSVSGNQNTSHTNALMNGTITGNGSISGAFTGTISAGLDSSGNVAFDINITP